MISLSGSQTSQPSLEDLVPQKGVKYHQTFVVPLRSTWVWGTPGQVLAGSRGKSGRSPQICAGQGRARQPGQALNESEDKNIPLYPFSSDVFPHEAILTRKKAFRVIYRN